MVRDGRRIEGAGAGVEPGAPRAVEEDSRRDGACGDPRRWAEERARRCDERCGIHTRRVVVAQADQSKRGARLFRRATQDARATRSARGFRREIAATAVQLTLRLTQENEIHSLFTLRTRSGRRYRPARIDEPAFGFLSAEWFRFSVRHLRAGYGEIARAAHGGPARGDSASTGRRRPDSSGDDGEAARKSGPFAKSRVERSGESDHPAHGAGRIHFRTAAAVGARNASSFGNAGRAGWQRRWEECRGAVRDYGQSARFSGIQDAEGFAGVAGQEQLRTA